MVARCKAAAAATVGWLNAITGLLIGRKLDLVDQRSYWESRCVSGVDDYVEVAADPYYQTLDTIVLEHLERYLPPSAGLVVEVGSYQGYRLNKYARRLSAHRFIGVDIGFENLNAGRARFPMATNTALINADACALPFRRASVDLVYTVVALSHISHRSVRYALREILAVASRYVVLVEIDSYRMRMKRRIASWRLHVGYMHRYDTLVSARLARFREVVPIVDDDGHARYTLFVLEKTTA